MLIAILVLFGADINAADDLTPLSDEFRTPSTLSNWQRVYQTEGWGNDALETFDFGQRRPGRLLMIPHTSVWYQEWRGELAYKSINGNFVITTDVTVSRRGAAGAPNSLFSLAGIMVRSPRAMTSPAQWTPGGQNYVFLSLGAANTPGTYQHEVKTTVNSVSTLEISPGTPRAQIQVARIGRHLILLRRPEGGNWTVHRRYSRPDFPVTLQAGLTVYTDWANCERVGFVAQNLTVLTNGARLPNGSLFTGASPDLEAAFDYVRYARPRIPANLANADFSNPASVSDSQLLAFLGDQAHEPTEALKLDVKPASFGNMIRLAYPSGSPMESHRLGRISIYAATDLGLSLSQWRRITAPLVLTDGQAQAMDTGASSSNHFYIAVEMP